MNSKSLRRYYFLIVIADAGYSAYKVYQVSMGNRIIPIVKGKKRMKRLKGSMSINLNWWIQGIP